MFFIGIADLVIGIDNKYEYVKRLCSDYIVNSENAELVVSVSEQDIALELSSSDILEQRSSAAYAEAVCVYRGICRRLPQYGAFLFHSSVVECDGVSYAFSAVSGTGKSTHTSLWLKHFGDRARIINGDKPIFRFADGRLRVYGTPWCGKEGYNTNAESPLHALCFIERGSVNEIHRIDTSEAIGRMFSQILLPEDEEAADLLFPLLEKLLTVTPAYLLKCNISDEAVTVAYNAMK